MDALFAVLMLACPVGMGLMMWVMMRGHGDGGHQGQPESEAEVARLRAELDQMRAAQHDGDAVPDDASDRARP